MRCSSGSSEHAKSLGIRNGGGKQGGGNQPPNRRCGPDTEIQHRPCKPHGLLKPSRILSKREADTEFQFRTQRNTPKISQLGSHPKNSLCGGSFPGNKGEEAPLHKELGLSNLYANTPSILDVGIPYVFFPPPMQTQAATAFL